MIDDRVVAYLHARAKTGVPADLVSTVASAIVDLPQCRKSWFAPPAPAAVVIGAVTAIMLLAVILGQRPDFGPAPDPTASPAATALASPSPTAGETAPAADASLRDFGDSVTIPIRSADGAAGTISVQRYDDAGGYPTVVGPSSETHFFIELLATYELSVAPDLAQWGDVDWRLEATDGDDLGIRPLDLAAYPEGRGPLGTWPGATVPEERYEGWLIFAIPRDAANTDLDLVYAPPGIGDVVRTPVRRSGPAPDPVALAPTPPPRPDFVFVEKPGLPFRVLGSNEADALFVDPDTCTNPEGGYTVSFPESWYTNTAIGDVPACSWFSPTFFEVRADGSTVPEVPVKLGVFDDAVGFIWVDLFSDEVVVDTFGARRFETGKTKDIDQPTDTYQYGYLVLLDENVNGEGRKLQATTDSEWGGDYELHRAVLDRIMARLRFE